MALDKVISFFNGFKAKEDLIRIYSGHLNPIIEALNDLDTEADVDVALKADIASPTFTGVVTTPALALVGSAHIPIDLSGTTPVFNQEHAFLGIGGWTTPVTISGQTSHFVPIQVNLASNTSVAADIAAARFRVNTAVANTDTSVNVLEMRSLIGHNVHSHANLQVSTEVPDAATCVDDFIVGYFSLQGDSTITCSNHVNVLEATTVCTGAGVKNVAHFTQNAAATISDILKVESVAGTSTNAVEIANTGGTVSNGLKLTGTFSRDILLSTGGIITNSVDGTITLTDNIINLDGDLTVTGHKNSQSFHVCTFNCPAPGAAQWTPSAAGCTLPVSSSAAKAWIPLSFLKNGDEIVSYYIVGENIESTAGTFDAKLTSVTKGHPTTIADVAGGAITQVTADGSFDVSATLGAAEVVGNDTNYMIEINGTTDAGSTIVVNHVMIQVNRK